MQDIFLNMSGALKEIWTNIGIAQKVSIILMIIATIAVMGFVVYMGARPQYEILYSGMDKQVAASVADLIRDEGISFKLENSGRTVLVQGKHINKLRLLIAQEGLPVEPNSAIKGWEQFDDAPLGMTEKQQKVMEIRAQQGELQKMINELPSVQSSRVMITFPEKRIFSTKQSRPAATVMIVLRHGQSIEPRSVSAIQHLVSTAVAGMEANDVTITDNKGNLLVRKQKDGDVFGGDSNNQLQIQKRMEEELKEKAEAVLAKWVGAENVVAMVSLEVDFDDHSTEQVNYDVKKQVVLHESLRVEENSKVGGEAGGKTGTESNLTVAVDNPEGDKEEGKTRKLNEEKKNESDRTFANDKTVTVTKSRGARITKLNVAVALNSRAPGEDGKVEPWPINDFIRMVSLAVGADKYGENGKVEVKEHNFFVAPVVVKEVETVEQVLTNLERLSNHPLVRPIVAFILLACLFRMFRKYFGKTEIEGSEVESEELLEENIPGQLEANEIEEEVVEENETVEVDEISQMIMEVRAQAEASPEIVASIMEGWLTSE